jgi:carboxyl-terminal processing protease
MKYVVVLPLVVMGFLTACGGGGSGENNTIVAPAISCKATETLKNGVCITPVANVCTTEDEKLWVRSYLDDVYLWYNEIKDVPRQNYSTPQTYFDALLVKNKDRYSVAINQAEADAFHESGLELGYGAIWVIDGFTNNSLRVAFVEPQSVADKAGIVRGDYLHSINGQHVSTLSDEELTAYLYPSKAITINVEVTTNLAMPHRKLSLQATDNVRQPVPEATVFTHHTSQEKVGYLLFNEHIATASEQLIDVLTSFKQEKINDLVLDLRFNGGGYAYIANELASMIGGQRTVNRLFQKVEHNQKHSAKNEYDFFTQAAFITNEKLPLLNLSRVFVLTSYATCSASEAIINSLSPFVEVIRIGSTTCGKPYGFEQANNCGTAYFAIQFQGENALEQSIPTTGFAPTCWAYDDLDIPLGQNNEQLLSTVFYYRGTNQCPTSAMLQSKKIVTQPRIRALNHGSWRNNMLLKKD